jgi:hypothetical protein
MFLVELDSAALHDMLDLAPQQTMFAAMTNVARIPLKFYHLVEQSSIVVTMRRPLHRFVSLESLS